MIGRTGAVGRSGPESCECISTNCMVSLFSLLFREDIWFDDVNPEDIEAAIGPEASTIARRQLGHRECDVTLVKEQAFSGYAGWPERAGSAGGGCFPLLRLSWAGTSQCSAKTLSSW